MRSRRSHLPGEVLHIRLRGYLGNRFCTCALDREVWATTLRQALDEFRVEAIGILWTDSVAELWIRNPIRQIGRFIQWLCAKYARDRNRRRNQNGPVFHPRFQSRSILAIVDVQWSLLRIRSLTCETREGVWFLHGDDATAQRMSHYTWECVDLTRAHYRKILNGFAGALSAALQSSRRIPSSQRSSRRVTVQGLARQIAARLGVTYADVCSKSRTRKASLARALVVWHVSERSSRSRASISRELGRDPSSTCVAIRRYRRLAPELFDRSWLSGTGRNGR